jgi:hypothetical protein
LAAKLRKNFHSRNKKAQKTSNQKQTAIWCMPPIVRFEPQTVLFSDCIWAEYSLFSRQKQIVFSANTTCIRPKYKLKTASTGASQRLCARAMRLLLKGSFWENRNAGDQEKRKKAGPMLVNLVFFQLLCIRFHEESAPMDGTVATESVPSFRSAHCPTLSATGAELGS